MWAMYSSKNQGFVTKEKGEEMLKLCQSTFVFFVDNFSDSRPVKQFPLLQKKCFPLKYNELEGGCLSLEYFYGIFAGWESLF